MGKNKITDIKIQKIHNLQKALEDIGIKTELDFDAKWFCTDNKSHKGIELFMEIEEGEFSFCFTPDGRYIDSCLDAPLA